MQLAKEYHAEAEDFCRQENVLTEAVLHPDRRKYSDVPYFFHMCTLGGNAVITADARLHPFLKQFMAARTGHWLFELPNLLPLQKELETYGYTLGSSFHMFLPKKEVRTEPRFAVKWFFGDAIGRFYGDDRFGNAISEPEPNPDRPDVAVVCAYDGETIMGMAGCSRDAENWYQIGIDVLPEYRSKGVGTALVSLLRTHIEKEGGIPFYGTGISNYHSWNIALNAGFCPAWVELGAKKRKQ